MAYLPLGNPIWSCQLHLFGGVRKVLTTAFIYAALFLGGTLLWIRSSGGALGSTGNQILRLLAGAQLGIIILGGAGAVHRALQRDYATRMCDTLRLSRMSAGTALAGYLFGGPVQMLTLFASGFIFGGVLIQFGAAGPCLTAWIAGNLSLLLVGVGVWSVVLFAGLGSGKPTNLTPWIIVLGLSSAFWLRFLPGLGLFTGAYAALSSWYVMLDAIGIPGTFGFQLAVVGGLAVFWLFAAARRYRKPWLPALDPAAAVLFVGLTFFCCIAGFVLYEGTAPSNWSATREPDALFHVTLMAPLLVLHLPAMMAVQTRRRLAFGGRPHGRRDLWPPTIWAVASAVVVVVGAMSLARFAHDPYFRLSSSIAGAPRTAWVAVGGAYVLAVLSSCALQKLVCYTTGRTGLATVATFILWAAPPGTYVLLNLTMDSPLAPPGGYVGWLFGCSPFGTLLGAWAELDDRVPLLPGIVIQIGLVVGLFMLARRAERILLRKRARLLAGEAEEAPLAR